MAKAKVYSAAQKSKVVLEALKEDKTLAELSSKCGVHSKVISRWKNEAIAALPKLFLPDKKAGEDKEKQDLIDLESSQVSVLKQCELLGLSRSTLYYKPVLESDETLMLCRILDEIYKVFLSLQKLELFQSMLMFLI